MVITAVLVWGIRESASFNLWMVAIKLVVLGFFLTVSISYVQPANWHPFVPNGFSGMWRRGRHRVLRLHRLRRHLHHRRGDARSAAQHADRDHRLPDHLHRHLHPAWPPSSRG
jgi:hypothetical protein